MLVSLETRDTIRAEQVVDVAAASSSVFEVDRRHQRTGFG